MSAIAGVSKTTLFKELASKKKQIANVKKKAAEYGENIMGSMVTIGGGAAAGYIAVKWPGQWMGIDKALWVGGGALLMGLTGLGGDKMSDSAMAFGNGVMAVWIADMVKSKVSA